MKIPSKIKLGAHTFKVIQRAGLETDDNFGKASLDKCEVFIRSDLPQSVQEETLLHEVFHVLRQLNHLEKESDKEEERETQILARAMYQFLCDNKLF